MGKKLKITVLKKELYKGFVDEYVVDKSVTACEMFEVGQVFLLDSVDKPDGFCPWAWADLHREFTAVFYGASFPWISQKNTIISCCTDGIRPVVFKIECVGEKTELAPESLERMR